MADAPQSLSNHVRYDPPFHFFLIPVAIISVIAAGYYAVRYPSVGNGWWFVIALAGTIAAFKLRLYALKAQDRVIRLEERLRLATVLPEPLRSRIGELQDGQMIGLRFASDGELPALVERAIREKLSSADIKKAIVNWRPDNHRV